MIGAFKGILPLLRQVQAQDRLIDLHPFHALACQAAEDLAVDRQQAFKQVELVERLALGLAQPQVSQRADQHGFDLVPQCLGFVDFFEQLIPAQQKTLVGIELRHQVVIVGVEPLGQLLGILDLTM
ncbi:hypothetical protein D3C76_1443640 [compost metagenome]